MSGSKLGLVFTSVLLVAGCVMVFIVFTTAMSTGEVSLTAALTALGVLVVGSMVLSRRENPRPAPLEDGPRAQVDINWYLTDLHIITFACPCSPGHIQEDDGYMFGRIKCSKCSQIWEISKVSLVPLTKK